MAGRFSDLFGTTKAFFKIGGTTGVRLKNDGGDLELRNTADSAYADLTLKKLFVTGNDIELNSDAAGSGADWLYTIIRPVAGMTAAVVLTLPVDDGTPGQVLSTDGSGNLSWASAGSTASSDKLDSTALAFGSAATVAMFSTGIADIIEYIEVIIDTAFDDTPTMSVGVAGTTSKYAGTTDIDLTAAAGTSFEIHPNQTAQGVEALIITYAAAAASVGAARVITHFATPS
jgi:hypothetical protein